MATSQRWGFVRTTLVGGALFLIPVVALLAILEKALGLLNKLAAPIARAAEVRDFAGMSAPRLVAIVILILICFLAGLVARAKFVRGMVERIEAKLLSNIPGYSFLKRIGESIVGAEDRTQGSAILVSIEDAWQIGFLMDRTADDQVVVFIPGAPEAHSGSVYVMTPDRIRPLNASMAEAVKCLRRLGQGSSAMLNR